MAMPPMPVLIASTRKAGGYRAFYIRTRHALHWAAKAVGQREQANNNGGFGPSLLQLADGAFNCRLISHRKDKLDLVVLGQWLNRLPHRLILDEIRTMR
jgi:hypothetical protein